MRLRTFEAALVGIKPWVIELPNGTELVAPNEVPPNTGAPDGMDDVAPNVELGLNAVNKPVDGA